MRNFPPGMVENCLRAGASPRVRDELGLTPLHQAAMMRAEDVEALIEAGADVNSRANAGTPLNNAARYGPPGAVRALIAAGASVGARDYKGGTPLHGAAYMGSAESVKALIAARAAVNARNEQGRTPLHQVASRVQFGSPPNIVSRHYFSARSEGPLIIEALLEAGADPLARDSSGTTPQSILPSIGSS